MRNLIFCLIVWLAILSCNQTPKTEESSSSQTSQADDTKALFEKNLTTLKASITAFENEQIDEWASYIADSAQWSPPAYGATITTKDEWKKQLAAYMADWDSLKLVDANFLPGIDSATHEFDGSVRYYGEWDGVHKSGVKTKLNFYGSYDFNKDGKIISGNEYFDVGGLMNAVKAK